MEFTLTFIELFFVTVYLLYPLFVLFMALIIIIGQVVCRIEQWEKYDALYWSLITATTVGYGDFRPLHKVSKALSIIIAVLGMMLTGVIIAITLHVASITFEKHVSPVLTEEIKSKFK